MSDDPTRPVAASQHRIRSARRLLRGKERAATGLFLAEGRQAVREALRYGDVAEVFVSDLRVAADLITVEVPVWTVSERELATITDTVTPQGIVAVCRKPDQRLEDVLGPTVQLMVCCAAVRDPGNAGTVIRCADAFGADGVVFTEGSVDVYNPKTVRASVGSVFHLPVASGAALAEVVDRCRSRGIQVLAADGDTEPELPTLIADGTLARPTLWLFGNEAWGLPPEHRALADHVVGIPMYGRAESLNLSTAAAVCLFASATAQRNGAGTAASAS